MSVGFQALVASISSGQADGANQILHRPHQHIVAGPRPGVVEEDRIRRVDAGIVEEIYRLPAWPFARPNRSSAKLKFSEQLGWPG